MTKQLHELVTSEMLETVAHNRQHPDNGTSRFQRFTSASAAGSLLVRRRGGHFAYWSARGTRAGVSSPLFMPAMDTHSQPKVRATHPMCPVGINDGFGDKHGPFRFLDFVVDQENTSETTLALAADIGKTAQFGFTRQIELGLGQLHVINTLHNNSDQPLATSMGERLYLARRQGPYGLTINGQTLDQMFGDGAEEDILSGNAHYWPGFDGEADVQLPNSSRLLVRGIVPEGTVSNALIWSPPGQEALCIKPVVGYEASGKNDGLVVPALGRTSLTTSVVIMQ